MSLKIFLIDKEKIANKFLDFLVSLFTNLFYTLKAIIKIYRTYVNMGACNLLCKTYTFCGLKTMIYVLVRNDNETTTKKVKLKQKLTGVKYQLTIWTNDFTVMKSFSQIWVQKQPLGSYTYVYLLCILCIYYVY